MNPQGRRERPCGTLERAALRRLQKHYALLGLSRRERTGFGVRPVWKRTNELVAQLVEQRPFKAWVLGSIPSELTTSPGHTSLPFRRRFQAWLRLLNDGSEALGQK